MNTDPQHTLQLPGQWSTSAAFVDEAYYFIYWTSVVLFVPWCSDARRALPGGDQEHDVLAGGVR